MGNFNYMCGKCGWGPNGHGEDGRDYFGKPCQVIAKTKDGKEIRMNGEYSGYGYVELPGGQEFYLKQYEEHWDGWLSGQRTDELGPFTSCGILCDRCAYVATLYPTHQGPTPMTEYSLSDFETVKEYLEKKNAPPPPPAAPAPAPAAKAPKKVVKLAKPKALTKAELEAKVLELQREVDRLKPMEKRLQELDKAYQKMYEANNTNSRRLKKIQDVFYGRMDYSDDE
jgi:hypothetical protein